MGNQSEQAITDKDILEIALKIERDGKAFYKGLSNHVSNSEVKSFLEAMSKEESLHETQLKILFEEKGNKIFDSENNDSLNEFIKTNFQTDIFPDIEEIFSTNKEFESLERAINFAIDAENTSKEFYRILGEYCDDFEAKTALIILEKAESEHLKRVLEIKENFF
ncbi:MAG: ferritin-like domain-containing protein [Nitrospinales bacterium]